MANDINHVVEIGRLCRDADLKYTSGGMAIAEFSIAVSRTKTENGQKVEDVNYFDVKGFGKMAEGLKPYLSKGKQICVEGHLKQDRWKDNEGQNRSKVYIVADNLELLGGRNDNGGQPNYDQQQPQSNGYGTYGQ